MRAARFHEYGGPEVLAVSEVDEPHPGPGEIRVAVRAAGVNALEGKVRQGLLRDVVPLELPAGIGGDASGIVDEVGDGVRDVSPGDPVFGSGSETYAEYAVLTSWARTPPVVSSAEVRRGCVPPSGPGDVHPRRGGACPGGQRSRPGNPVQPALGRLTG